MIKNIDSGLLYEDACIKFEIRCLCHQDQAGFRAGDVQTGEDPGAGHRPDGGDDQVVREAGDALCDAEPGDGGAGLLGGGCLGNCPDLYLI